MASVVQCVAHMQGGYYSAFFPLSVFPYVAWGCLELTVLKAGSELLVPLSSPASSVLTVSWLSYIHRRNTGCTVYALAICISKQLRLCLFFSLGNQNFFAVLFFFLNATGFNLCGFCLSVCLSVHPVFYF